MSGFSKFKGVLRRAPTSEAGNTAAEITPVQDTGVTRDDPEADEKKSDLDLPDENAQRGVQDVEAVALAWSKKSLITVFGL
jgi:hypothetical protein